MIAPRKNAPALTNQTTQAASGRHDLFSAAAANEGDDFPLTRRSRARR